MINSNRPIKNKRIVEFMMNQLQPYWTVYQYGGKLYIMTFEYRVYEVTQ